MKGFFRTHPFSVSALLIFCIFTNLSCASLYFQALEPPAGELRFESLRDLPYREQWAGFVFNGEKVGFSYLKIEPLEEQGRFLMTAEAHLRILFMGLDKRISMRSEDVVRADLSLLSFRYEQDMDGKALFIEGRVDGNQLRARQRSGERAKALEKNLEKTLQGPLYPASAINLYPVLKGMNVGSKYRYDVFDPQTQSVTAISQSVITYEKSPKLSIEPSFQLETDMLGQTVTTWINTRGETVFELAMGGVLITYREDEHRARQYLAEASLNKKDVILDFSLVKTDRPLPCPREALRLEIGLEGVAGQVPILQGPGQSAFEVKEGERTLAFYIVEKSASRDPLRAPGPPDAADRYLYLAPSDSIESDSPEIRETAEKITASAGSDLERIRLLAKWVSHEVKDEIVDSFSALEVLRTRKGECQAHTMLYAALARAAGIPTRLAGGLVYMEDAGFLYHAWAESYAEGWIAVDPTYDQVGVDATHIKLLEGHSWISMMDLGKLVGRVKARVVEYRADCVR